MKMICLAAATLLILIAVAAHPRPIEIRDGFSHAAIGTGIGYLWPDSPWWANYSIPFSLGMLVFSVVIFFRHFIDISKLSTAIDRANDEMLPHGRGLSMALQEFDIMEFNDRGNQIILVKYYGKGARRPPRFIDDEGGM